MGWSPLNYRRLLRYAGMFTLVCAAAPLWVEFGLLQRHGRAERGDLIGWLVCQLVFALVYLALTGRWQRSSRVVSTLGLAVMTLTALGAGWFSHSGISALLLVIVAMILPWFLPWPLALAWMLGQHLLLVPFLAGEFAFGGNLKLSIAIALLQAFTYLGISSLSFIVSWVAYQQAEKREAQRALNAELRATRALLAESSRLAERMHIARELHDLVGHHLIVLSLHLELASHLGAAAGKQVKAAQHTAKQLLADVREVVSELRQDDAIELGAALRSLAGDVPGLVIHMDLPVRLQVADPQRAQALLRCVQEIVTNVVRHAQARHLWLQCRYLDSSTLVLDAHDDGRGAAAFASGHGLRGMRERLAAFGGALQIDTAEGRGFALRLQLPLGDSERLAQTTGRIAPTEW